MGETKKNFPQNVISVRITDEELADLNDLMGVTRKRVSALLRDALLLFMAKHHGGQARSLTNPAPFGDKCP